MYNKLMLALALSCGLVLGSAIFSRVEAADLRVAIVDVQSLMTSGPNAKKAKDECDKAQAIYQQNLDTINEKLKSYKDRRQADALSLKAGKQLQAQFDTFAAQVNRAMLDAIEAIVAKKTSRYDIILPRAGVLASKGRYDITAVIQDEFNRATIAWPTSPSTIDDPQLPADNGAKAQSEEAKDN